VQQGWLQRAGRTGERKKVDSRVKNWMSQNPAKLATRGTAACQGPYQKLQVCALALVWAAFLGARKQGSGFKFSEWRFRFSALPQRR